MKKMGRPSDNPKKWSLTIRLDERSHRTLEEYCRQYRTNKTQAVYLAIAELQKYLKK